MRLETPIELVQKTLQRHRRRQSLEKLVADGLVREERRVMVPLAGQRRCRRQRMDEPAMDAPCRDDLADQLQQNELGAPCRGRPPAARPSCLGSADWSSSRRACRIGPCPLHRTRRGSAACRADGPSDQTRSKTATTDVHIDKPSEQVVTRRPGRRLGVCHRREGQMTRDARAAWAKSAAGSDSRRAMQTRPRRCTNRERGANQSKAVSAGEEAEPGHW